MFSQHTKKSVLFAIPTFYFNNNFKFQNAPIWLICKASSADKILFIKGYLWKYQNGEIENKIKSYDEIKLRYNSNVSKLVGKLSKVDVINLVKDKENGLTYAALSKKYKITSSCAYEIVIGKTYKWVWE